MWDAHDAGRLELYLSASTVTDIFYICRKQVGADRARMAIMDCLNRLNILLIDRTLLTAAVSLSGPDYEDNIQIACAQAAGLDLIITRDAAGFAHAACLLSRRLTSRGICRSHNLSRNRLPLATAMTLAEKI